MYIEDLSELFDNYEKDEIIQNFIAQADSRYILYCVKEKFENFPKYTPNLNERCTSIAINYLACGYNFFFNDEKIKACSALEKAATILEHIYCFEDCKIPYKDYYRIICSLAYYASSQYSKAYVVLSRIETNTTIASLIKLFLTKQFSKLQIAIDDILFDKFRKQNVKGDTDVYIYLISKYFLNIIMYVYNGNEDHLKISEEIINDLIVLSSINEEPHMWWIFRLLQMINYNYKDYSLWGAVDSIIDGDNYNLIRKYINANIYKSRPVTELFKSQIDCLEQIKSDKGTIISIPTSSGKTKIAEMAILKSLIENPDSICLYIAPFRSLAREVESSLSNTLGIIGYRLSNLYGNSQYTQMDKKLIEDSHVIIATPEKAKSIIRSNDTILNKLKLVIVDEGHLIGNQDRYIINELFIEELKIILKDNSGKMIFLSAVLPNLSDFSKWITGEEDQVAYSNWRPSSQRLGILELSNNAVNLIWLGKYRSFNNRFIETRIVRKRRRTKSGRLIKDKYFPEDKKQAIAATAVKLLSNGSVLIYVGKTNMVLSQAREISKIMKENNISHQWKDINTLELVKLACKEAYGENSEIFRFIMQGIVCHHAKLPTDVKMYIERLMSNDSPKIIIATSTLAQGVNIGVSTVIISNVYLGKNITIDNKDFWNIAGRAGRSFVDTEGKILYAIDKDKNKWNVDEQIEKCCEYFNKNKVVRVESGVFLLLKELYYASRKYGIDYETFLELISENDFSGVDKEFREFVENKFDLLDDTLLSLNIKYQSDKLEDSSAWIDEWFRETLIYISAKKYRAFNVEKVLQMLKSRNKGIIKMAGDSSNWSKYVNSSISLRMSIAISEILDEIIQKVIEYMNSNQSIEFLLDLIRYLDEIICKFSTKNINTIIGNDKDVNIDRIRDLWFNGIPINKINEIDDVALKVINNYYRVHFPWIVSSIARKMQEAGFNEESKVMENIALFSEIGLPNIISVKIYLAGIRSRKVALEISNKNNVDVDISISDIKLFLLEISSSIAENVSGYSEEAINWLNAFNRENQSNRISTIRNIKLKLVNPKLESIDKILIKKVSGKYYVCSFDYAIKIGVNPKNKELFDELTGMKGIYFEKISDELWTIKSKNPYVVIK